jgi:hypothetical protein
MSVRTINVSPEFMSSKKKKIKNKTLKNNDLCEPITINTTNIRKMLLEKLKQHKKTKKNTIDINTNSLNDPPYGNLKNGDKPTYRQFTLKQYEENEPIQPSNVIEHKLKPIIQPIENVIQPLPSLVPQPTILPLVPQTNVEKVPPLPPLNDSNTPKTIKKTYHLGKNNKNKSIGILIKSSKTRKVYDDTKIKLKKEKMTTIKNYLKKQNLIKFGTTAPTHLLKDIYENSNLSGIIYNKNNTNLIHNYNEDDYK